MLPHFYAHFIAITGQYRAKKRVYHHYKDKVKGEPCYY